MFCLTMASTVDGTGSLGECEGGVLGHRGGGREGVTAGREAITAYS